MGEAAVRAGVLSNTLRPTQPRSFLFRGKRGDLRGDGRTGDPFSSGGTKWIFRDEDRCFDNVSSEWFRHAINFIKARLANGSLLAFFFFYKLSFFITGQKVWPVVLAFVYERFLT